MFLNKLIFRLSKSITRRFIKKHSLNISKYNPDLITYLYDEISWEILTSGEYEKDYLEVAIQFLKNIHNFNFDYFIDVGANIGTTALNIHNYFNKIISIEANPRTYKILELNTKEIENISLFEFAISDKEKSMRLTYDNGSFAGAYIVRNKIDKNKPFKIVNGTSLDKLLSKIDRTSMVIKLDIEGEELNALRGSMEIIKKHSPVFIIEINKREIKNNSSDTFLFLKRLNYTFYNIQKPYIGNNPIIKRLRKNESLEVVKVDKLIKKYRLYPTLICVPNCLSMKNFNI